MCAILMPFKEQRFRASYGMLAIFIDHKRRFFNMAGHPYLKMALVHIYLVLYKR